MISDFTLFLIAAGCVAVLSFVIRFDHRDRAHRKQLQEDAHITCPHCQNRIKTIDSDDFEVRPS